MSFATPLGVNDGHGWTRVGHAPGPVMRAYRFMRVERGHGSRWRCWDAIQVPLGRHPYAETTHMSLRAAKQYAVRIVAGDEV